MSDLESNAGEPTPTALPRSVDAERSILGGVLIDNRQFDRARELLTEQAFYSDRHRKIFLALVRLSEAGTALDLVTLKDELQRQNTLEACGGPAYIAGLLSSVPRSRNVAHYARIVLEKARKRDVIRLSQGITEAALNGTTPAELEELIEELANQRSTVQSITPRFLDLSKVATTDPPPVPSVLKGWFAKSDCVVIGGYGGSGKSLLAQDLALALASGKSFLGLPVLGGPYRVLYLDEENPDPLVWYRMKRLAAGRGLEIEDLPLRYSLKQGLNLDDPAGRAAIWQIAEEFKPDFTIFDTLTRFHHRDENSNSEMSEFFGETFAAYRRDFDSQLTYLHHLSKPSATNKRNVLHDLRGASEVVNYPDVVIGYGRDGDTRTMHLCKSRWVQEGAQLIVQLNTDDQGHPLSLTAGEIEDVGLEFVQRKLAVAADAGVLRSDLKAGLAIERSLGLDTADKILTRTLGRLHANGHVKKKRDRQAVRYWLTDSAPEDAE